MRRAVSSWLASSACSPRFIPSRRICSWGRARGGCEVAADGLLELPKEGAAAAAGEEAGGKVLRFDPAVIAISGVDGHPIRSVRQSVSPLVRHAVSRQSHQSVGPDPSVLRSVSPSVRQFVNPSVRQSVSSSVRQFVNPSVRQSSVCQSVSPSLSSRLLSA